MIMKAITPMSHAAVEHSLKHEKDDQRERQRERTKTGPCGTRSTRSSRASSGAAEQDWAGCRGPTWRERARVHRSFTFLPLKSPYKLSRARTRSLITRETTLSRLKTRWVGTDRTNESTWHPFCLSNLNRWSGIKTFYDSEEWVIVK